MFFCRPGTLTVFTNARLSAAEKLCWVLFMRLRVTAWLVSHKMMMPCAYQARTQVHALFITMTRS